MKNITEPWPEFNTTDNTGHFMPWQLAERYKNTDITIKGRTAGDKQTRLDDDGILVLRLENLSASKAILALCDQTIVLDFTGATLA